VIFVDANVPQYIVGDDDRRKLDAQSAVERLTGEGRRLVTSSEVFQEILHRYASIARRGAIEPAFEVLRAMVDEVLPMEEADVFAAKDILNAGTDTTARDALHVAVMRRRQITEILTFDRGFDVFSGISRLPALGD
jgi:predicted nucleic acid-binding protein